MLLLTGPPGSGKTSCLLGQIREELRAGRQDFRLLVPTATMAEHLRNTLAREGFAFQPRLIGSLSRFVEPWAEGMPETSASCLDFLIDQALAAVSPADFEAVARFPGFRTCLARLIDELSVANCNSNKLKTALDGTSWRSRAAASFADVLAQVERSLERRGLALPADRLRHAAARIASEGLPGIRCVFLDGFFTLGDSELLVLDAIRRHADVCVSLSSWAGADEARAGLLSMGFAERRCERLRPQPTAVVVAAGDIEQEAEEIARRILEQAEQGRLFREMGIVVRSRDPYVPGLETALERFGIPARFYFAQPLAEHSAVRFLSGLVEAMLGGWDHEETLRLLRMAASGCGLTAAADILDFDVRERLPGKGLDGLRTIAQDARIRAALDDWTRLDEWRDRERSPAGWSEQLAALPALFQPAPMPDSVSHDLALLWRSQAAALEAFEQALEDTAQTLADFATVPFMKFWKQLKTSLRLTNLRVPERRRNVVHVMDVYEARQWELPVVFLCGLLERQFPLYHSQDPILPDDARVALRKDGLRLRTAAELDREERFLFELAVSRATSSLVLSYPQFSDDGEETLRSFYLDEFVRNTQPQVKVPSAVRPQPRCRKALAKAPAITDGALRAWLREQHAVLSPSGIESFLECPFRFFAEHTLGLEGAPAAPSKRLDASILGGIAHMVLARWIAGRGSLREHFESVFEGVRTEKRIPAGYLTEACRRELLRDLERFAASALLPGQWQHHTEMKFELPLPGGLTVRGRIDRLDISPEGTATVIDYKYSRPDRVSQRVREHEDGKKVQGGLYMLAAEREPGSQVAAVLFAALRGEASWKGWHVANPAFRTFGQACTSEMLRELGQVSVRATLEAAERIREGVVAPQTSDGNQCEWCEFSGICRVEIPTQAVKAGGESWG